MSNRARRRAQQRSPRPKVARPGERVVAGYLSPGDLASDFHESLCATFDLDRWGSQAGRFGSRSRIHIRSGANISRARNNICRHFLAMEDEPEWLWLIDTDMRWEPAAVEQLLQVAEPDRVVGGLCFAYGPTGNISPTIYFRDALGRHEPVPDGYQIPERTLLQVHGTGGAFLLVHRSALLKIHELAPATPNPWFREHEIFIPNPDHDPGADDINVLERLPYWISEDLFFCDQVARHPDLSLYVHTGVEVAHRKPHFLTRALYESDTSAMEWA
jgi:hypothetical protein